MKHKSGLDMDKIARGLKAERRGTARAAGGYFGAEQLVEEVRSRFRAPGGGGRSTDPAWTERRLVPLAPDTLDRLQRLADLVSQHGVSVGPLQVAALLLQRAAVEVSDEEVEALVQQSAR